MEESDLNPTLDNWFDEEMGDNFDNDPDNIDEEYVMEAFPETRNSVERITDMLQEESSYILRQATSAINKVQSK